MLLSDKLIKHHLKEGNLVIDPFNEKQLGNVSYDLTLGHAIARYKYPAINGQTSEIDTGDPSEHFKVELNKNEHKILPGERILGHSREFAGGSGRSFFDANSLEPQAITSYLQATSTAARIGLTACLCAGWGDVGYFNRWTLEIFNLSPYVIRIPVGAVISQICFESVVAPDKYYGKDAGNYQQSLDINKIKQDWDPLKHMLPKKLKVYE